MTMVSTSARVERVDQTPRGLHRIFFFAGVLGERAAALLRLRNHHLAAFGREHAGGGFVDICEKYALDAAEQQADALALRCPVRECVRGRRALPKVIGGSSRSID